MEERRRRHRRWNGSRLEPVLCECCREISLSGDASRGWVGGRIKRAPAMGLRRALRCAVRLGGEAGSGRFRMMMQDQEQ